MPGEFEGLNRYWNDPAHRSRVDAEIAANRARVHAAIDRGMDRLNQQQRARWAREEEGA